MTELIMILDRSGSMYGMEEDTMGGFNSMLEQQKKGEDRVLVSTVLFSSDSQVLYDRVPLEKVNPMRSFPVGGSTALLDALGGAIHHIGNVHKYARPEDRPDHTIVVVITDGHENSSTRYDYRQVRTMVKRQEEKYGWDFIFLGAGLESAAEAVRMGISRDRAAAYCCDHQGTALNFQVISETVADIRRGATINDAEWKRLIEEDYQKRRG